MRMMKPTRLLSARPSKSFTARSKLGLKAVSPLAMSPSTFFSIAARPLLEISKMPVEYSSMT
uniref:Uncharacterized protein n=1 Tax=Arundo donax TaxID=35708 RepID=A0A0A9G3F2_ARUDO